MAESIVQVTEGSGKKLHTFARTIGGNVVEDEVVINGEHYLASYRVVTTSGISAATANSHILQVMAGASLHVMIRRIRVFQSVVATTAAFVPLTIFRLTTAGTGGTALTPAPLDTADAASGATAMTLPTVKGTEGTAVAHLSAMAVQTIPTGGPGLGSLLAEWDFDRLREKGLRIPSGTANGIALKNPNAVAGMSVYVEVDLVELNFT